MSTPVLTGQDSMFVIDKDESLELLTAGMLVVKLV
jgi:hypothetical protein